MDQFIVVTMSGRLFIGSADSMIPVKRQDESKYVRGYYYDLSDPVELKVENGVLVITSESHPDQMTEVEYTETTATSISQTDINDIEINSDPKRLIQISYLSFDGETCIIGSTLLCYT